MLMASISPAIQSSGPATPADMVLRITDALVQAKSASNTFFQIKMEKQQKATSFARLDEGLYERNNRIFARVKVNGKLSWRSTKTNKLAQARKWKEKWEHKQWLDEQGFAPKEPPAQGCRPAGEASSGPNGIASKNASMPEATQPRVARPRHTGQ